MADGTRVSCSNYIAYLVSQEPVYDKEILKDVRPITQEWAGYYQTGVWNAYDGVEHTVDRFHGTFPNTTLPWNAKSGADCVGNPCDPDENKIGWGNTRETYGRDTQSWGTEILCFDAIMTKTRAKEHFRHIIEEILRPATKWITAGYLSRRAAELAGKKFVVATGLPDFTFTWDAGGYEFLNTSADPTGRLTPNILKSRVSPQYLSGAISANAEGYENLELHTDPDTLDYLMKQDPILLDAWRFKEFEPANVEFFKYGFRAKVGNFMAKALLFPQRFNKVSAGRYQVVLPYKNVAATNGIKSIPNPDFDNAQYQFSYINNRRALKVRPFQAEALNPSMPFLTRDYAGKWKFVTNDLGSDCNGRAIDNSRGNKGKFIADYDLSVQAQHPEWLELIFHKRDKPCITIVSTCNEDPGYPAQTYDSVNALCPSIFEFIAVVRASTGNFVINANTISANGNLLTHGAVNAAGLAALVAALPAVLSGVWAIGDAATNTITLTGSTAESVTLPFVA